MAQKERKPTTGEVAAAVGRTVPDLIAPGLAVLFCGINPGLYSAATRHHFARPGNRFWRTLHAAGWTDRLVSPWEEKQLLEYGLGITNLVARSTATAAELGQDELQQAASRLERKSGASVHTRWRCLGSGHIDWLSTIPKLPSAVSPGCWAMPSSGCSRTRADSTRITSYPICRGPSRGAAGAGRKAAARHSNAAVPVHYIIWEYEVRSDALGVFEALYGPNGAWARLFRSADGIKGRTCFAIPCGLRAS